VNEERQNEGVQPLRKTYVHILGAILLVAILASGFILGPLGILNYMVGLSNSVIASALNTLLLLPILVVAIWGLLHSVRTLYHWHKLNHYQRWLHMLLAAACAASVVPIGLGFCGVKIRSLLDMEMSGFRRYARIKTDVPAIQVWLGTLDPNDCQEQRLDMEYPPGVIPGKDEPKSIPRPLCLKSLRHADITLSLDGAERPMIQILLGGSGMLGHWGIVVGDPNMEIPKKDDSGLIDYRMPLAPGAYFWYHE
jgi:hypothetical protein